MNIKKIHYESVTLFYFIMYNISTSVSCNFYSMLLLLLTCTLLIALWIL